jgi:hypothetical protein
MRHFYLTVRDSASRFHADEVEFFHSPEAARAHGLGILSEIVQEEVSRQGREFIIDVRERQGTSTLIVASMTLRITDSTWELAEHDDAGRANCRKQADCP